VRDPATVRKALEMRGQKTYFTHDGADHSSGLAAEVVENRGYSAIGSAQRHYRLQPVLVTPEGVCTGVVVIAGSLGTYVYPGNADGEIADYVPLGVTPPGTGGEVTLAVMGYRVAGVDTAVFDAV
jgi:hypothetical protein